MFLIFLIKHICLLAFYFTCANMIFVDSVNSSRLIIYFIILASLSLSYIFRNNKKHSTLKYLLVLGFAIAVLCTRTIVGAIVAVIPYIYMIYLIRKNKYYEDYYSFRDLFIKLLILSAFLLIIVLLIKRLELFYKIGLQYAIMFIISGLYLLRTMRHSEDIITNKKFLSMNLLIITITCLLFILFSTDVVLSTVISGIKFVYIKIIIPTLSQVFYIIFSPLGRLLDKTIISKFSEMSYEMRKSKKSDYKEFTEEADITTFYILTFIFVSIVLIFLIYFLTKWILNRKRKNSNFTEGIVEHTSFLNDDIKKKNTKCSFYNTNQTRFWYKKFLELCRKKEMYIFTYDNSQTIYNKSSKLFKNHDEDLENIKEIYRKARYGEDATDKQNIKIIKSSYKSLEKKKIEK